MRPKLKRLFLATMLIAAGFAVMGCTPESPVTPTQIVINNNQTTTVAGGGPTTAPSPGSTTGGIVEVRVPMVGENCPSGVTPVGVQRQIRVGCSAFVTCTPKCKDAGGNLVDCPPSVHGPAPSFFNIQSGSSYASFSTWDDNRFNADVRGQAPGDVAIACTVLGVTGTNLFTVVR
jgi:hypothetical protein